MYESVQPENSTNAINLVSLKSDIVKVVGLYDSHFPYNLSVVPLLKFLKDYKPDVFIFGGDNWSLDCISHWNNGNFKNWGMDNVIKKFNAEAEAFKAHIGSFIEALPNCKIVYLIGNHEDWMEQFSKEFPQTERPTLKKVCGEYGNFIEFIPRGGFYQVGHLYFAHGDQFGSANPAKQAVERTNKTIVIGHHHTFKVWPDYSIVDAKEKHLGIQVPCFCGMAPEYGKGRPNSWLNGFFTASVKKKSGNFSPFIQMVGPKGNFITQNGTEYF